MRLRCLTPSLPLWALLLSSIHIGSSIDICESRTINYITHTLPQQCLRTTWSATQFSVRTDATTIVTETSLSSTAAETPPATDNPDWAHNPAAENTSQPEASTARVRSQLGQGGQGADAGTTQDEEDLATGSFMSFEEWKSMMLKKSGQDPIELRDRRRRDFRDADQNVNGGLDVWGDDSEIALDFDVLADKIVEMTVTAGARAVTASTRARGAEVHETTYDDGMAHYRRPKDAGKTCKERFSFSSFDGGATVLKTSAGAKNAKAILVENKDSYMLFTCSQDNKFVIVELTEDILVDTVVLANFEFFSSMIRTFRISVSDKYPVKMEKWNDLGTFQARNSRDMQPFLIDNPKVWAKYIRIEFLSHYGNEYYCPVSLLRVHGTRMLDSWRDAEAGSEDEEPAETLTGPESVAEQDPTPDEVHSASPLSTNDADESAPTPGNKLSAQYGLSPWYPVLFDPSSLDTCGIGTPTRTETVKVSPAPPHGPNINNPPSFESAPSTLGVGETIAARTSNISPTAVSLSPTGSSSAAHANPDASTSSTPVAPPSNKLDIATNDTPTLQSPIKSAASKSSMRPPRFSAVSKATQTPSSKSASKQPGVTQSSSTSRTNTQARNTTASSSTTSASPIIQESFFKSVSKRLQFLESNTTLSLQYIEEQSRFLQEALKKMERKQIHRVDTFLVNLNSTVFSELRKVRQDYDQIWQSTVIALETQREQFQRDVLALRDEVLFQKRMAIIQSALLLCCLVLVVFSRGVLGGGSGGGDQWPLSSTSQFINSYLASPRWPPATPQSGSRFNTPARDSLRQALRPTANVAQGHSPQPPGGPGLTHRNFSYMDKILVPPTPPPGSSGSNDSNKGTPRTADARNGAPRIDIIEPSPEAASLYPSDRQAQGQDADGIFVSQQQDRIPAEIDAVSSVADEEEEEQPSDESTSAASCESRFATAEGLEPYLHGKLTITSASQEQAAELANVEWVEDYYKNHHHLAAGHDTTDPRKLPLFQSSSSDLDPT